jgi:hypothetical protein
MTVTQERKPRISEAKAAAPQVLTQYTPGEWGGDRQSSFSVQVIAGAEIQVIKFAEGIQVLSIADWSLVETSPSPIVKKAITEGIIKKVADTANLVELESVPQAVQIVKKTYRPDLLRRWMNEETRQEIYDVISARLLELETEPQSTARTTGVTLRR